MLSRLLTACTATVVLVTSAFAHGPTPLRASESVIIDRSVSEVWAVIEDFGAIAEWNPRLIESASEQGNQVGSEREISFDTGGTLTELLDHHDPEAGVITWRLLREDVEVFPVSSYSMRLTVSETDGGSEVEWSATFFRGDTHNEPPEHLSDDAARQAIHEYIRGGLEQLEAELEG